jgi:hypothetical protein
MADTLTCATCSYWRARYQAVLGDCDLGAYYGRAPFDHTGCPWHSQIDRVPDQEELAMQSQTRGMTMQEWQRKVRGQ